MFPNSEKTREAQRQQIVEILRENPVDGEELVEFLYGIVKPSGWIYLFIGGILSAFLMKYVLLVRTSKRIIVVNLNMRAQFGSFVPYQCRSHRACWPGPASVVLRAATLYIECHPRRHGSPGLFAKRSAVRGGGMRGSGYQRLVARAPDHL